MLTLTPILLALEVPGTPWMRLALVVGVGVLVLLSLLTWQGLYRGDIVGNLPSGLEASTRTAKCVPMVVLGSTVTLAFSGTTDPKYCLGMAAAAAIPLLVTVPAMRGITNIIRQRIAPTSNQRVLIVGCGDAADRVAHRLERTGDLIVVGMVDDDPPPGLQRSEGSPTSSPCARRSTSTASSLRPPRCRGNPFRTPSSLSFPGSTCRSSRPCPSS